MIQVIVDLAVKVVILCSYTENSRYFEAELASRDIFAFNFAYFLFIGLGSDFDNFD